MNEVWILSNRINHKPELFQDLKYKNKKKQTEIT